MKKTITLLTVILSFMLSANAQSQYQVLPDKSGGKTLKGILSRELLMSDTSFSWFAENQKGYSPNKDALEGLKKYADSVQLLVFMGTWCEDSHFIIPKLFSLADAAGFKSSNITLVGVDRDKKTLSHLSEALNVTKVPTIIVMRNGKEEGRVVEFGKYGLFDMDLGTIFKGMQ